VPAVRSTWTSPRARIAVQKRPFYVIPGLKSDSHVDPFFDQIALEFGKFPNAKDY
jgi:hypothetical protein